MIPDRARTCACTMLLLIALTGTEALAGGFSNLDFGLRRVGMLAVTARPDDITAIFHNPAGLTMIEGTQFYHQQTWSMIDMGLRLYDSEGRLRPDHDIEPEWNVGVIPFLGLSTDLGQERLRLGFGLYAPNAYGASMSEEEPTRYHATRVLFVASRATASVAYELSDRLSVGLGLSLIHVYLTARRHMSALVLQDPDHRFDDPKQSKPFDAELEMDGQDLTWSANLGLLLEPSPGLRLGAAFTRGAAIELDGKVKLTQADGAVQTTTHTTTMVIPFTLRAGINWEFVPDFELGLDIFYWHYQVYQEQRTTLGEPIMGMKEMVVPKNYGNSWNWCIGLMYHLSSELELMFGYQQDYSPIPKETFSIDTPTTDLHGVSTGLRWQATEGLRVGLGFVRNWYELIDVQESRTDPPSNVKGHGGNTELGFEISYRL